MRTALQQVHPDVILLQEVVGRNDSHAKNHPHWPSSTQFEFLAQDLWPYFAYGKNAIYTAGHHGNAILSKFPIIGWENLDVSTNSFERRGLLHAILQPAWSHSPVHTICAHLGLFENDRQTQIDRLCRQIIHSVPKNEPLLIAGDFNDWRQQATSRLRDQIKVEEVFYYFNQNHARTFPSWMPVFCLDRIYFRGMTPLSAICLQGKPWNQLSDHTAITAQLKLTE